MSHTRYEYRLDAQADRAYAAWEANLTGGIEYLRKHTDALFAIRYAGTPGLGDKARAFYAALPPAEGDNFRDACLEDVKRIVRAGRYRTPLSRQEAAMLAAWENFVEEMRQ